MQRRIIKIGHTFARDVENKNDTHFMSHNADVQV